MAYPEKEGEENSPGSWEQAGQTGMSAPHFEEQGPRLLSDRNERAINTSRRRLPHWTCDRVIYWITFRLADSLPQTKFQAWRAERDIWLQRNPKPWSDAQFMEYNERFGDRMENWLNAGYGSCVLKRPEVCGIVQTCLLQFEGERLHIHAAVIMPNHVHLLLEPLARNKLSALLKGIKGASARKANQLLGTMGTFWLDESFDHILRSEPQYWYLVKYIAENPKKAGLHAGQYWHYQNTFKPKSVL